ncbi:NAD(P)H-hydrate dehydratase [Novosphingobium guangzhouense]|uniref:Bifunctional NAD(P)H-hydrate repair enzyme n=1 Tax=Novosphingobium guangzhouense TaxID=1850347 RepID=A0A2K2G2Q9_9SPHN|nr:NAD(P)H-hydrate dehydratase [Novosphingobium guangzhouense]PNU05323.1 bifunctional ADP-dependent (S)-NAD(P)H-hydrate dehydratase/NAD(P)H-hydrate epimerase [Novosphingobium guangzhouense]
MPHDSQILAANQMRDAEQALIDAGASVDALMQVAGRGAAEWVWRMAGHRRVTVLCGPGNNGGDGYVLAEAIRERGGHARVVAAAEPATDACRKARALFGGEVLGPDADATGDVLVDCLFGTGLTRPLSAEHAELLNRLAAAHQRLVAVDLPSGVQSDSGMLLNERLPVYDLTIALGAWKFAHFLMPASARMGRLQRVPIGVGAVPGAALAIAKPQVQAPTADAHKYRRGLLAVVGGAMPGAAVLAGIAAQRAGAGYVKLFAESKRNVPADLVVDQGHLSDVLVDDRNTAVLVGPGLGRDGTARERLAVALADAVPVVIDADALVLLAPRHLAERDAAVIATPHEGELVALERAFDLDGAGTRPERALALAAASGMVVVAKGPDTVVAAPDGRIACAARASPWLSTAGTGDVLAGVIASRVATGRDAFDAACEGVWLHGEAARLCPPAFTAGQLAEAVPLALAECL